MGTVRRIEQTLSFEGDSRTLWSVIRNTDAMNRSLGFPKPSYHSAPGKTARIASVYFKKIPVFRWVEFPFQWQENSRYCIQRKFFHGPIRTLIFGMQIGEASVPTRLTVFAEMELRWEFFFPALRFAFARLIPKIEGWIKQSLKVERGNQTAERKIRTNYLSDLKSYLLAAPEHEIVSIRPFELADKWKAERLDILKACLQAVSEGWLEMNWEIVCGNCRVPKVTAKTLKELPDTVHCELCQLDYSGAEERFTEVRFSVTPGFRRVETGEFCIGSPNRFQHILLQAELLPGQKQIIPLPSNTGSFRIRTLGDNKIFRFVMGDSKNESSRAEAVLTPEGWQTKGFEDSCYLEWENKTPEPVVVVLETERWLDTAATVAHVTSLSGFQDLFPGNLLRPDQKLGVSRLTFLFSDLKDSTRLYEVVGDMGAYRQVQVHFGIMERIIGFHDGRLVKTIGDVVMAAFYDPTQALKAALEMQRVFSNRADFEKKHGYSLTLKLGLHSGPCILVNGEKNLDYFGRTVNQAARIQGMSEGDDIVFSQTFRELVDTSISELRIPIEKWKAELKGISGEKDLFRIPPIHAKGLKAA